MKTPFSATALILTSALIGSTGYAATSTPVMRISEDTPPTPYSDSGLTRAQVRAEYLQARKDGTLPRYSEANEPTPITSSGLTRDQVRAEYFQALKDGTLIQYSEAGPASVNSLRTFRYSPTQAMPSMAGQRQKMAGQNQGMTGQNPGMGDQSQGMTDQRTDDDMRYAR